MAAARLTPQILLEKRLKAIYAGHKTRANSFGKVLDYNLDDLRKMVKFLGLCPYCRLQMVIENFTFDHMVAVSQGGKFTLDNLLVCCTPCNEAKLAYDSHTWAALLDVFDRMGNVYMKLDFIKRLRAGNGAIYGGRKKRWTKTRRKK